MYQVEGFYLLPCLVLFHSVIIEYVFGHVAPITYWYLHLVGVALRCPVCWHYYVGMHIQIVEI